MKSSDQISVVDLFGRTFPNVITTDNRLIVTLRSGAQFIIRVSDLIRLQRDPQTGLLPVRIAIPLVGDHFAQFESIATKIREEKSTISNVVVLYK